MENPNQPLYTPPQPATPTKKRFLSKKIIIFGLVGIVLVVLISIGVAIVTSIRDQQDLASLNKSLPYDLTAPLNNVPQDKEVGYSLNYDPTSLESYKKDQSFSDAIRVFTDSSLTRPANATVALQKNSSDKVTGLKVTPSISNLSAVVTYDQTQSNAILTPRGQWGPNSEVFIVRYLDDTGKKLEKPLVTRMSINHALEAPTVTSTVDEKGNLTLSWNKVEGATHYYIAKFPYSKKDSSSQFTADKPQLIGETSNTTWNSTEQDTSARKQNIGFVTFTQSEDAQHGNTNAYTETISRSVEYGVIATKGEFYSGKGDANYETHSSTAGYETSAYQTIQGDSLAKQLPYALAENAANEILQSTPDTIDGIPEKLPVTLVDGTTVMKAVTIDAKSAKIVGSELSIKFSIVGTDVAYTLYYKGFNPSTYTKDVERIAARNETAQQKGGLDTAYSYQTPRTVKEVSRSRPSVDYPVNSTDAFTDYVAANMIAGNEFIDIGKYLRTSSLELDDVIKQVRYQNPYILGFEGSYYLHRDEGVLEVRYAYTSAERETYQKQLKEKSEAIIKDIIKPGMSDRDKALAINNYLVSQGTYNYDALAASKVMDAGNSSKYRNNWSAIGILLDGTGICKSYADAYKLLSDIAGLKTITVTGNVDESGHAWNKTFIDGKWQNIDTTWNDGNSNTTELFGLTDEEITTKWNHKEDNRYAIDGLVASYAAN